MALGRHFHPDISLGQKARRPILRKHSHPPTAKFVVVVFLFVFFFSFFRHSLTLNQMTGNDTEIFQPVPIVCGNDQLQISVEIDVGYSGSRRRGAGDAAFPHELPRRVVAQHVRAGVSHHQLQTPVQIHIRHQNLQDIFCASFWTFIQRFCQTNPHITELLSKNARQMTTTTLLIKSYLQ